MLKQTVFITAAILLAVSVGHAADKVKVRGAPLISGTITQMNPDEVVVEQGPVIKKVPVNQIISIEYDEEPSELGNIVRNAYEDARFDDALAGIGKLELGEITRPEILQDVDFYKAASMARLALGGGGPPREAGGLLAAFEAKASGNYHYLEVCELLGDLLVAAGKVDNAQKYYDKLASSAFPEYKLKAGVLGARALESQKKYDAAIAKYDEVINSDADGKEAVSQKQAAMCGKASALGATGKTDEAIKLVEDVISQADAADLELHARAHNALGSCYRAAGKKKEALFHYLHTDLLFAAYPEQHAEALAALSTLWMEADKADRAAFAKSTLKDRYPGSRWAQGK